MDKGWKKVTQCLQQMEDQMGVAAHTHLLHSSFIFKCAFYKHQQVEHTKHAQLDQEDD